MKRIVLATALSVAATTATAVPIDQASREDIATVASWCAGTVGAAAAALTPTPAAVVAFIVFAGCTVVATDVYTEGDIMLIQED